MFVLLDPRDPDVRLPLGSRPRFVGRGAGNDLVLDDPRVSGKHLSIWIEGDEVCVVDLGSRNGTTLRGQALSGMSRHPAPVELVLGEGPTVRVEAGTRAAPEMRPWHLREVDRGTTVTVLSDRFVLGRDVVIPGVQPDQGLTLLVDADGRLWREAGDDAEPLSEGDVVQVGDSRWSVGRDAPGKGPTTAIERTRYPYRFEVRDIAVRVTDGSSEVLIGAPNRYALLVVLARARAQALAEGDEAGGWVDDETLATGIWGARHRARSPRVVLCRVRADLRDAGLDPWCLEKRVGGTRLRVHDIELGG